jgi:hypothetical protein
MNFPNNIPTPDPNYLARLEAQVARDPLAMQFMQSMSSGQVQMPQSPFEVRNGALVPVTPAGALTQKDILQLQQTERKEAEDRMRWETDLQLRLQKQEQDSTAAKFDLEEKKEDRRAVSTKLQRQSSEMLKLANLIEDQSKGGLFAALGVGDRVGPIDHNLGYLSITPGRAEFMNNIEALQSLIRSAVFETLKGGGHITEVESEFARDAVARLKPGSSRKDFDNQISRIRRSALGMMIDGIVHAAGRTQATEEDLYKAGQLAGYTDENMGEFAKLLTDLEVQIP